MRYLKNEPRDWAIDMTGHDPEKDSEDHQATVIDVLLEVLRLHNPVSPEATHKQADTIREFNNAMNVIEGEARDDGYYELENAEWGIIQRAVTATGPTVFGQNGKQLWRLTPDILTALEECPTEDPAEEPSENEDDPNPEDNPNEPVQLEA